MGAADEQILKASEEIVVKFIETGRVSPASFPEVFKNIYKAIEETVKDLKSESGEQKKEK
jgi:predicted transcriptional regulator